MLKIRFARVGKKGYPTYRIVVAERRSAVQGKFVTRVGSYDPHTKKIVLDKDATLQWLKVGAQPSNSVAKILQHEGVKHGSIKIKKYRAVSKKELEAQKTEAEKERQARAAEQEAQKARFEADVKTQQQEKAAEAKAQETTLAAAESTATADETATKETGVGQPEDNNQPVDKSERST